MWNIGIGPVEFAILALLVLPVFFISGPPRRWLVAMIVTAAIGVFLTPPDPLSAVLVTVPLAGAFACGVYLAPLLHRTNGAMH